MTDLQKRYEAYRSQLAKLNEQKDAWYTVASQKFSEGDKAGQDAAYAEIDAIQVKIDALVNPMEENDKLLGVDEDLFVFDN